MDQEMTVNESKEIAPLTTTQLLDHIHKIQDIMKEVLKKDIDYGVIPGTQKPTLLKPGAEKLIMTFRLAPDLQATQVATSLDEIRYMVKCSLFSVSGNKLGDGLGECSSNEEKYAWKKTISDAEWFSTPKELRRLKHKRAKGGGSYEEKQVRTNPADQGNTILKMAKKRALVDAVLTVTAASDIFIQDAEEFVDEPEVKKEEKTQPLANGVPSVANLGAGVKEIKEASLEPSITIKINQAIATLVQLEGASPIEIVRKYSGFDITDPKTGKKERREANSLERLIKPDKNGKLSWAETTYSRMLDAIKKKDNEYPTVTQSFDDEVPF